MRGNRERIPLASGTSFRVIRWARSLDEVEELTGPDGAARIAGEGDHWHHHAEMELTWFATGTGTRCIGDHLAPFAAGDLVLLGGMLPHCWHVRGGSSGLSAQWRFPAEHPFWAFPETRTLAPVFREAARGLRFTGRTAATLTAGLQDCARSDGVARLGALLRLLGAMAAAPPGERTALARRSYDLPTSAVHQQAMGAAIRFLLARFRERIRLDDVLLLTRMSRPTFSRLFRQHAGRAFSEFLNQVRLQAACQALATTDQPVLDIALDCGFTQVSFFNRLFRRVHHCSPTLYRRRRRRTAGADMAAAETDMAQGSVRV